MWTYRFICLCNNLVHFKIRIILRDCKCNFKLPYKHRRQCPIHNSTLHSFVWSSMNYTSLFYSFKIWIKKLKTHQYLPHQWDKGFKGTTVNQALPFFHEVSLEITLTVPLTCLWIRITTLICTRYFFDIRSSAGISQTKGFRIITFSFPTNKKLLLLEYLV